MRVALPVLAVSVAGIVAGLGCLDASYPDIPSDPGGGTDVIAPQDGSMDPGGGQPDVAFDATDAGTDMVRCMAAVADSSFLCLADSDCATGAFPEALDWLACAGVLPDVPWGSLCPAVTPGTCVPGGVPQPCDGAGCPSGHACVRPQPATDPDIGTCRALPAGACWADIDCAPTHVCAGVSSCGRDRACGADSFPGVCMEKLPGTGCWDDAMCGTGMVCVEAELCPVGGNGCVPKAGRCDPTDRAGCGTDNECGTGRFCVGPTTAGGDGWCVTAPGLTGGDCWRDDQCDHGQSCLGARQCPPGTLCYMWDMHPGICGDTPRVGQGLTVTVLLSDPEGRPDRALVVNRGPVPIFVDRCLTVLLQYRQNDVWPSLDKGIRAFLFDATCTGQDDPLMRLATGDALVLTGYDDLGSSMMGGTARPVMPYLLGCRPGQTSPQCISGRLDLNLIGQEVEVP